MPSFSVASYNVMANAYVQRWFYRRTPKLVLKPLWRTPAVTQRVASIGADLLCLQEVEPEMFAVLESRLTSLGYRAHYAPKRGNQPDGCAIFYREDGFELVETRVVEYTDGAHGRANAGHIALISWLRTAGRVIGVANTHLTWDPPGTAAAARLGLRQTLELLGEWRTMALTAGGWLICGDLNATPESDVVAMFLRAKFQYAHAGLAGTYTCKVNDEIKMIDYIFFSPGFRAEPVDVLPLSQETILPSAAEPSDHLPIVARLSWTD